MRDLELNSIGDCLIAFGFNASNEAGHKFRFELDGLSIYHRGFMWVIEDEVNGKAEYLTLKEMIRHETWRWEEE